MESEVGHHISERKVGIAYYSYRLGNSVIVTDAATSEVLLEVLNDEIERVVDWIDVYVLADISQIASDLAKER
jgi:diacylglycerol kinase